MADIKDLGIFRSNKGLDKIRAGTSARKNIKQPQTKSPSNESTQEDTTNNKEIIRESQATSSKSTRQNGCSTTR